VLTDVQKTKQKKEATSLSTQKGTRPFVSAKPSWPNGPGKQKKELDEKMKQKEKEYMICTK